MATPSRIPSCLAPAGLLGALLALGCVSHHHHAPVRVEHAHVHQPGPPPHAPAHGYRHKHRDGGAVVQLEYDSRIGVYVVVGRPDHYFHAGRYYRLHSARWVASAHVNGPWRITVVADLPEGLRARYERAEKSRGRTRGPAKLKTKGW